MCLAIPARVVSLLPDNMAQVEIGGIEQEISLDLVDDVTVGSYVIVHVGYALQRLDEEEAAETLQIIEEAAKLAGPRVTFSNK